MKVLIVASVLFFMSVHNVLFASIMTFPRGVTKRMSFDSTDHSLRIVIHEDKKIEGIDLRSRTELFHTMAPEDDLSEDEDDGHVKKDCTLSCMGLTADMRVLIACCKNGYFQAYNLKEPIKDEESSVFWIGMSTRMSTNAHSIALSPHGNWFFIYNDKSRHKENGFCYGTEHSGPHAIFLKNIIHRYDGGYVLKKMVINEPEDQGHVVRAALLLWGDRHGFAYHITLREIGNHLEVDHNPIAFWALPRTVTFNPDGSLGHLVFE